METARGVEALLLPGIGSFIGLVVHFILGFFIPNQQEKALNDGLISFEFCRRVEGFWKHFASLLTFSVPKCFTSFKNSSEQPAPK
jgi:hypothetical protein